MENIDMDGVTTLKNEQLKKNDEKMEMAEVCFDQFDL